MSFISAILLANPDLACNSCENEGLCMNMSGLGLLGDEPNQPELSLDGREPQLFKCFCDEQIFSGPRCEIKLPTNTVTEVINEEIYQDIYEDIYEIEEPDFPLADENYRNSRGQESAVTFIGEESTMSLIDVVLGQLIVGFILIMVFNLMLKRCVDVLKSRNDEVNERAGLPRIGLDFQTEKSQIDEKTMNCC